MIDSGNISTALKHIYQMKLGKTGSFDIKALIGHMLALQQFDNVIKYARRFELTAEFPVEQVVEAMLEARLWRHALKIISSAGLSGDGFKLEAVIRRAADAGNFVVVTGLIEDANMDPTNERKLDNARRAREAKKGGQATTPSFEAANSPHRPLLVYVIDQMMLHRDWYRAMKYARDWELDDSSRLAKITWGIEINSIIMHFMLFKDLHCLMGQIYLQFVDSLPKIYSERKAALKGSSSGTSVQWCNEGCTVSTNSFKK